MFSWSGTEVPHRYPTYSANHQLIANNNSLYARPIKLGAGAWCQIVDVQAKAWHSRWMPDRHSVRRLLLIIVLSQTMVIQALLVAWSSTQAAAGALSGISASICSGTILLGGAAGGTEPAQPGTPRDCFNACVAAQVAAPPDRMMLLPYATAYARMSASRQMALPEIYRQLAFSARAPPRLT